MNKGSFISSFPTVYLLSPFLVLFHYLSSRMLKSNGEAKHPCLVFYLIGKNLSLLPLSMILAVGFRRYSLIKLRKFSSIHGLPQVFFFLFYFVAVFLFVFIISSLVDHNTRFHQMLFCNY